MSRPRRTLVAMFAHPDDEVFLVGGVFARHAPDAHVVLVSATRGELGEISDPSLATPETLAEVRERELREAAHRLGVEDVRFLGYRDSGMIGTPGNQDPRSFMQADPHQVVGQIVTVLRELPAAVVVTFDQSGGYGHPDHLAIHRFTTQAFAAASDPEAYPEAGPAVAPGRLFYAGFLRRQLRAMLMRAQERGVDLSVFDGQDISQLGIPDDAIDAAIDVSAFADRKIEAMRAHRTQFQEGGPIDLMSDEELDQFLAYEYFQFGGGVPLPDERPVSDLFAGWSVE